MDPPPGPATLPVRYEALRLLGEGAFGTVHLARDRELGREVAVKLLKKVADPDLVERFTREARVLARLEHPHVVRVFDHGVEEGQPFLVTEYLEGATLEESRPEDPFEVLWGIAEGLQAAHDQGLVHRDVKPANVFLTRDGRALLLDFGLVSDQEASLTLTGQLLGTPMYMAPESLRGRPGTPAADWYSWGATLWEMAAGHPPFSSAEISDALAGRPLPDLDASRLPLPPPRRELVRRCLAEDPDVRPRDLGEARRILEGRPPPASAPAASRPRLPWLPAVAAATLALVLGVVLRPTGPALAPPALVSHGDAPADPPTSLAEAPGFPSHVLEDLKTEVDRALEDPGLLDARSFPAEGEGGTTALLSARGVGALGALAGERAVLAWMRDGGDLRAVSPEARAVLEAHDRPLAELGFPPTFAPFLEALPAGPDWEVPEDLPEPRGDFPVPFLEPDEPGFAWWRTALTEASRCGTLGNQLKRAGVRNEIPGVERLLAGTRRALTLGGQNTKTLDFLGAGLYLSAEGRDILRDLFREGRGHARRFLIATARALDARAFPGDYRFGLYAGDCYKGADGFLIAGMLTASRTRLFGPEPRTSASASFQVAVLLRLRQFRTQVFLRWSHPDAAILPVAERALALALAEENESRARRTWVRCLTLAGEEDQLARAVELFERYRGRFLDDCPEDIRRSVLRGIAVARERLARE